MLKTSSFTSNRLQYPFKVPAKWDGGSGKTRKERTHSRYSKCEIQRYASNCNCTVNLPHSRFGIDNFNILEGPSNGFEMIHFFEESLQAVDHVGNRMEICYCDGQPRLSPRSFRGKPVALNAKKSQC